MNITLRTKRNKIKKAQQLIEFLLVVPFMVIILGILTEYAYALNVNMTLSEGLKTVTSSIYGKIKPGMTDADIQAVVLGDYIQYLSDNNVPINDVSISRINSGQNVAFVASYTYTPAFTLPNIYFTIMPDKFKFSAIAVVPSAFLGVNNYDASLDSEALDKIWSSSADFSSQDSFNDSKKGILKSGTDRDKFIFLVPTTATGISDGYAFVSWDGTIARDGSGNMYVANSADGEVYSCTDSVCTDASMSAINYIQGGGYYQIVFVHDDETPTDLSTLGDYWIIPVGTTDLASGGDGILKRAVALVDTNGLSVGNYDNIDVSSYNEDVSASNLYTAKSFGSKVVIYTSSDGLAAGIGAGCASTYNYDFGGKVN